MEWFVFILQTRILMNTNNSVHKVEMTIGTQLQETLGMPILETFPWASKSHKWHSSFSPTVPEHDIPENREPAHEHSRGSVNFTSSKRLCNSEFVEQPTKSIIELLHKLLNKAVNEMVVNLFTQSVRNMNSCP